MIVLKNVTKRYGVGEATVYALRDVSCTVGLGELVAVTGPSGSGKSTLMNVIGCLDRPTSGTYELLGKDVSSHSDDELASVRNRTIGFVFQSFNLLPKKTALENVALPLVYAGVDRDERLERARQHLVQVGLGDRITHKPGELSGGQCQRVAIARALVTEPKLLLADEPTGNLDSRSSQEIMEMLVALTANSNMTVMIVTHDPSIASQCRRQLRVVDGRIAIDKVAA